jgi:hypothetical protein
VLPSQEERVRRRRRGLLLVGGYERGVLKGTNVWQNLKNSTRESEQVECDESSRRANICRSRRTLSEEHVRYDAWAGVTIGRDGLVLIQVPEGTFNYDRYPPLPLFLYLTLHLPSDGFPLFRELFVPCYPSIQMFPLQRRVDLVMLRRTVNCFAIQAGHLPPNHGHLLSYTHYFAVQTYCDTNWHCFEIGDVE